MEESYRKLLEDLIHGRRELELEAAVIEAHKVVTAKRRFEQAMDRAYTLIANRHHVTSF